MVLEGTAEKVAFVSGTFHLTFAMLLQYSALVMYCQEAAEDFPEKKSSEECCMLRTHTSQELAAQTETFAVE